MADISGPGGSFTSTNFSAHFSGWALAVHPTNVENTGFAENGNRTYLTTAQNLTVSVVGTMQDGSASLPSGVNGTSPTYSSYQGTAVLTAASGKTMSFLANLTVINIGRPNDGKADFSASLISSGPLSGNF